MVGTGLSLVVQTGSRSISERSGLVTSGTFFNKQYECIHSVVHKLGETLG